MCARVSRIPTILEIRPKLRNFNRVDRMNFPSGFAHRTAEAATTTTTNNLSLEFDIFFAPTDSCTLPRVSRREASSFSLARCGLPHLGFSSCSTSLSFPTFLFLYLHLSLSNHLSIRLFIHLPSLPRELPSRDARGMLIAIYFCSRLPTCTVGSLARE